ncbi:SHOCT domain-containing protein [Prauserella muralis]|uniref:SHOCT domain-containing protein n=1 Tax=Prauserella muralis TaxID=588067 RepID=A0A2V4B377_9PSEU|nr:SHOCT domain-containing protein [Prauserella muralis]PXY28487.1 hypothetical protein BAY60_18260 [Prauserella muralis]
MMFWYGDGMSGWGYTLMTVSMVLFWGLLILGVIALIRFASRDSRPTLTPPAQPHTPEQVLAERFARGEIDEDEYHRRLDALHAKSSPARET